MTWTPERVDTLRQLAADGLTASQIAGQLRGVTRSAVIGKLHRMGTFIRKADKPKPQRRKPQRRKPRRRTLELAAEAPVIELPPDQSPDACGILDLKFDSCRWILGEPTHDARYCGSRTLAVGPYCARHALRAYQPMYERGERV